MKSSWHKEGVTMTAMQNLMLSCCFGAVIGNILGNVAFLIKYAWDAHKEKKRKKAEEAEKTTE